jgi:hypothetical protein
MKYARECLALLALLGGVRAAPAQFFFSAPYAGGFAIGVSRHGRHGHLSAYLSGGYGYVSPYYDPSFYYPPLGVSRVTVLQVYNPPTVVIAPPPVVREPDRPAPRPPQRPPPEEVQPPQPKPPGEAAGGFRPVRPDDRARPPEPPAKPAPKPPEPPKDKPKEKPPQLSHPPLPENDPRAEGSRLTALGRTAFAAAEYGRAALRFGQATRANPDDAGAHFLLAQAEFALGKYDQAVEAIQAGMRLEPDWPTAAFRPVTLYDGNVADLPEHLRRLDEALAAHPDDPVLLFLYAYQLWFDGRQDEARPLFQWAAAVAPDKGFSERFLLARPDKPVL